jgi:hypothetical protein
MLTLTRQLVVGVMVVTFSAALDAQSPRPLHVDPSVDDCSVRFASTLTQSAFHRFTREFGGVSAFKQMASAATLGRGRIAVGIEMMSFRIDEWSDAWHDTFVHPNDHHPLGSDKQFPKIKVRVGATDNLDIGAFYSSNPRANYGWAGVDARYRLVNATAKRPLSFAVRGAYTRTLYVDDMSMHAFTADLSADRRFWREVRSYVGVGADAVIARETSASVTLRDERIIVPHVFGGIDVPIGRRLAIGAEFTVGARPTVQLQIAGILF